MFYLSINLLSTIRFWTFANKLILIKVELIPMLKLVIPCLKYYRIPFGFIWSGNVGHMWMYFYSHGPHLINRTGFPIIAHDKENGLP